MIKLGNYELNKSAQEILEENELKLLRENLSSLIRQIEETLQPDVVDMVDTYLYIKQNDKHFSEQLWSQYLTKSDKIDMNSYWGFGAHGFGEQYYFHITTTRYGVGCYHDCNGNRYNEDSWWVPEDIKDGLAETGLGYTKEQLKCMIDSAQKFIAYFPSYRDGFFKCVSEHKVN